ncbi:MAG TPA: hypothetical protein VGK73_11205, partial [Polyangiaceae bacterium]
MSARAGTVACAGCLRGPCTGCGGDAAGSVLSKFGGSGFAAGAGARSIRTVEPEKGAAGPVGGAGETRVSGSGPRVFGFGGGSAFGGASTPWDGVALRGGCGSRSVSAEALGATDGAAPSTIGIAGCVAKL